MVEALGLYSPLGRARLGIDAELAVIGRIPAGKEPMGLVVFDRTAP